VVARARSPALAPTTLASNRKGRKGRKGFEKAQTFAPFRI
jgi:hypothetical protein